MKALRKKISNSPFCHIVLLLILGVIVDYSASPQGFRHQNCAGSNMIEYAVWASAIAKASGIVNTSLISLTCSKDLEKKRLWKQKLRKSLAMGMRWAWWILFGAWHARHAECYCDISKMAQVWNRQTAHRQPLFSISRAEIVFHGRLVSVFIVKRANACVFIAASPLLAYPGCQRFLIFPHSW